MKKYVKAEIIAKNDVTGSYAAGCPAKSGGSGSKEQSNVAWCRRCERSA